MKTFADKIIEFRTLLGYNQVEFSDFLGLKKARLSVYETGKSFPNFDFFEKIKAKIPNANIDWFFGEGEMFSDGSSKPLIAVNTQNSLSSKHNEQKDGSSLSEMLKFLKEEIEFLREQLRQKDALLAK